MKNIIHILTLMLIPFMLISQNDKIEVQVDGLGCMFCAYGLEKKMKDIDDIGGFTIDMETGLTKFEVPTEQRISMEQIDALVAESGYTPIEITIDRADGTQEHTKLELPKAEDADTEISFHVNGNCDMCKKRIENSAYRAGGVGKAEWNKKKKILTVLINKEMTDQKTLETAIANVGYETENMKSLDEAYEKLPECCQYKRKK